MKDPKFIAEQFAIEGNILDIKPLGSGLINDTFRVYTDGADDYVLQRINNAIFKDVELLQHNIDCATAHIRKKGGFTLTFLPCKATGKTYWTDGETYWRVSVFIRDSFTYNTVNPEYSYCAGKAFGEFEAMLADIPDTLGETIPDFHNMELRARQLREAVREDKAGRMAHPEVQAILKDLQQYEEEMCQAERWYREGKLPKRICHCDTKVNNMLFDKDGHVLCVIDLDTLMPSFVFSDFGDFMRTAANTVAEDDPAIEKVALIGSSIVIHLRIHGMVGTRNAALCAPKDLIVLRQTVELRAIALPESVLSEDIVPAQITILSLTGVLLYITVFDTA